MVYLLVTCIYFSVLISCTDACCRFRSQHNRLETPSYELQARTPSSVMIEEDPSLYSGKSSPNGSFEKLRTFAFKRRNSTDTPVSVRQGTERESSRTDKFVLSRKRRQTPASIKTESDVEGLPTRIENKARQDQENHSWKLHAVEVKCRHCSERKLLTCSYLKLSPTLVQSGILPIIPRLEGESICRAKPGEHSENEECRLPRTAACA